MSDILTLRVVIENREKAKRLWENHMDPKTSGEDGYRVGMLAWGDPYNEALYVLERVQAFLQSTWKREEILEAHGLDTNSIDVDFQLQDLIEIWGKEAYLRYGPDVTYEQAKEWRARDKEKEKNEKEDHQETRTREEPVRSTEPQL